MRLNTVQRHRLTWGSTSLLALLAAAPAAIAAPAEPVLTFALAGGTLESVLTAYAARANVQLLYTPEVVRGRRSDGLSGEFTAKAALARLLDGTGIVAQQSRPGVMVLRLGLVASAEQTIQTEVAQAPPSTLDEVIVTGTHIRGVSAGPSPVVSFDRDEIDRQGYATVADSLAALPQNYSGGATPDVLMTGLDTTTQNSGRATTVNLRGLGADATLVLINGRRMAGSGGKGDLADVSAIPTAAVQRIDVLLDGASALYGADAVGGVVNIILRRDFDGAETRARYGGADGVAEVQVAQTLGRSWDSGHALVSYEYYDRGALAFADRAYTASADLRPFGGTDRRGINASPGNVLLANPATGALTPVWAIPSGVSAFPLRPSDFRAGVVNLTSARASMDLLPSQERHSLYAAVGQDLGAHVRLSSDLRFSHRATDAASLAPTATIAIADNNPFFASPNGSRSHQIAYSFENDLGPSRAQSLSDSLGVSIGLEAELPGDWRLDGYGAYAREATKVSTNGLIHSLFLREAAGATADNPATPFRAAVDGYFNPYGDGRANGRPVLDFIGSGYTRQSFRNALASFNLQADGALIALPGGDAKLALGVHGRRERFTQRTETFGAAATPAVTAPPAYQRNVLAAFAELRAPLIGEDNALPGVQKLELSLAARIERYDDVGTTTNPKVGLTWAPMDGLRVRATYGTSFRAPVLSEVFQTPNIGAVFFTDAGVRLLALSQTGGNPDLKPETATSWTFGFDAAPAAIPGLKLGVTVFDTDFSDQIDRPVSRFIQSSIRHPAIAPFVRFVDPARPDDLAAIQALLADPAYATPGLHPPSAFSVIVDNRYVNTGRLHVRGFDLSADYGFELGENAFDLSANASYLLDYELQPTPTTPTVDYVGVAGLPVDLRARVALSWRRESYGATLGINYVDAYRTETGPKVDAWTTADVQVRWTPEKSSITGLTVALSVQNLFDADPPFYDSPTGVGYDAANAEPLGRFASIQLTQRW